MVAVQLTDTFKWQPTTVVSITASLKLCHTLHNTIRKHTVGFWHMLGARRTELWTLHYPVWRPDGMHVNGTHKWTHRPEIHAGARQNPRNCLKQIGDGERSDVVSSKEISIKRMHLNERMVVNSARVLCR